MSSSTRGTNPRRYHEVKKLSGKRSYLANFNAYTQHGGVACAYKVRHEVIVEEYNALRRGLVKPRRLETEGVSIIYLKYLTNGIESLHHRSREWKNKTVSD